MPAGRPRVEIDWEEVKRLSEIQCTQEEIASVMGVALSTLKQYPQFSATHKEGMEHGRKSLRRMQYEKAMGGNITMLIWLGKQYLGQSDKQEVKELRDAPEKVLEELEKHQAQ